MGITADLDARLIKAPKPHKGLSVRVPGLGRLLLTRDQGSGSIFASEYLQSHLQANHFDGDGRLIHQYDLGSGKVQSNLVVAMMQDQIGTASNLGAPVLSKLKYMYSGTSSTAETNYDFQLGTTISAYTTASITPTLGYAGSTGTNAVLTYVGTITYTSGGPYSVQEWGLFNTNSQGAVSNSTVNTWNAQGGATSTWGTTLGASNNLVAGYVAVQGTTGLYIISNTSGTSGVITGAVSPTNAYYNLTTGGGAGSTFTTNTSTTIYPLMGDHKTFSVITANNGDAIQFTYTLTIQAGG